MMLEGKVSRGSQDGSKSISQQMQEIVNNSKKDIFGQLDVKLEQLKAQAKEDFKLIQQSLPAEKKKPDKEAKEEIKRKPDRSSRKESSTKEQIKEKVAMKIKDLVKPSKVEALKDVSP